MGTVALKEFRGPELEPWIDALGDVRIRVFREFPYLYDGSLDYEREYLRTYLQSELSLVVLALDGHQVVGATTCLPMTDGGPEFQQPFLDYGYDVEAICYFGESILLPEYRGRGIGVSFFEKREAHAQSMDGIRITTFCAVDRPLDHPLRPGDYVPLDAFWTKRGYTRQPKLKTHFTWKDLDEEAESPKPLTFWLREWPASC